MTRERPRGGASSRRTMLLLALLATVATSALTTTPEPPAAAEVPLVTPKRTTAERRAASARMCAERASTVARQPVPDPSGGRDALGAIVLSTAYGWEELGADPTLPRWFTGMPTPGRPRKPTGRSDTRPAGGEVRFASAPAIAVLSRDHFDPAGDALLEFDAKLSLVRGSSAWLGGVLMGGEYNYYGAQVGARLNTTLCEPSISAYQGENPTYFHEAPASLDRWYRVRVAYLAASGRALTFVDGALFDDRAWVPAGPFQVWVGSVASNNAASSGRSLAAFRNFRVRGTPVLAVNSYQDFERGAFTGGTHAVIDRTVSTGDDYLTGAGSWTSAVLGEDAAALGKVSVIATPGARVQLVSPTGELLPDAVVPGNAAGLEDGADLSAARLSAGAGFRVRVTLAGDADEVRRVTIQFTPLRLAAASLGP